jgi:hypothetical protein
LAIKTLDIPRDLWYTLYISNTNHHTQEKRTMITAKQLQAIAKDVLQKGYEYDSIGLRTQENTYGLSVGDPVNHKSSVWIDGDQTEETLNGICAVSAIQAARRSLNFGAYIGDTVLVIGSNNIEYGEDDGEIILKESCGQKPVILDIIQL